MIILGIDPGSRVTGYGVIRVQGTKFQRITSGVIQLKKYSNLSDKLKSLFESLKVLIEEFNPDVCSIETTFYGKNVQSTLKLGHIRGVIILAAALLDVDVFEYSPREVKRSVTGTGAAAKQQVEFMVKTLLGITTKFAHSDEADGIALALCHAIQTSNTKSESGSWAEFIKNNPDRIAS